MYFLVYAIGYVASALFWVTFCVALALTVVTVRLRWRWDIRLDAAWYALFWSTFAAFGALVLCNWCAGQVACAYVRSLGRDLVISENMQFRLPSLFEREQVAESLSKLVHSSEEHTSKGPPAKVTVVREDGSVHVIVLQQDQSRPERYWISLPGCSALEHVGFVILKRTSNARVATVGSTQPDGVATRQQGMLTTSRDCATPIARTRATQRLGGFQSSTATRPPCSQLFRA